MKKEEEIMVWLKQAKCWFWAVQGLQLDGRAVNISAFKAGWLSLTVNISAFKAGRLSSILNKVIPKTFLKMIFTAALLSYGVICKCEDSSRNGRQRWQ